MRRIFASGFRTGFVPSYRWIPSELNHSDERSHSFDRDYDQRTLIHALAQRIARSSPSRTNQEYLYPSRLHLDAGEAHHTPHTHGPAVSIRSQMQPDELSNCTEHAAAVSFQSSSIGRNNCIGSLSCGLCPPVTLCRLPPGLVVPQVLG